MDRWTRVALAVLAVVLAVVLAGMLAQPYVERLVFATAEPHTVASFERVAPSCRPA
jgi:hypothetical protein